MNQDLLRDAKFVAGHMTRPHMEEPSSRTIRLPFTGAEWIFTPPGFFRICNFHCQSHPISIERQHSGCPSWLSDYHGWFFVVGFLRLVFTVGFSRLIFMVGF